VSPSHRLQLFTNCPSVVPFPKGAVLQQQAALARVPHGITSPASKPAPEWASLSLSMGPQILAEASFNMGFPQGHSFLQAYICSNMGSLPQAKGGYLIHCGTPWSAAGQLASPWSSSQAAGERSVLWHLEHLLPPPFSLTLVSAGLFLSLGPIPLSNCRLKYVITEELPQSLTGLAFASGRSVLEPASTGLIRCGGSFHQLLTEATPRATHYQNRITEFQSVRGWKGPLWII